MSARDRSLGRRVPSGPFSRLVPSFVDPLDSVGLPSKGDTRLNDTKAQESYYTKIVERYVKFCADSGSSQELEKRFASMSTDDVPPSRSKHNGATGQKGKSNASGKLQKTQPLLDNAKSLSSLSTTATSNASSSTSAAPVSRQPPSTELTTILHAMRKLRESIVATSRRDLFAQHAYVFIIRASILVRHFESYHPALLYLLYSIHPQTSLSLLELHEFVGYQVLDLACRQNDVQAAYAVQWRFTHKDRRVCNVLSSVVHDDWIKFWRAYRAVDGHQRALMEWTVPSMRMHALKCLGQSYFTAEKSFVERSAAMAWEELVTRCNVGWELDGEKVTIRRPKAK